MKAKISSRRGISEVFGALMLILVVVVVVAGIAVFVAQAQKQQQALQNFQTSVKDDKLDISNIALSPSDPSIDFMLTNYTWPASPQALPQNSTKFYVSYVNETSVKLYAAPYNANDPNKAQTCDLKADSSSLTASVRYSGNVTAGVHARVVWQQSNLPCFIWITGPGNSTSPYYSFSPATWDQISMTVRNLNVQNSGVYRVAVNDNYARIWSQQNPDGTFQTVNVTSLPTPLAAQSSTRVFINYSIPLNVGLAPAKSSPLSFIVESPAANFFKASNLAPSPVPQVNGVKEDYSVTSRTVLFLDGSQTTFSDGAFPQQFTWQIDTPVNGTWSGSWTDTKHIVTKYLVGKITEYRPESIYNSAELNNLLISGPIRVTLKVADNLGIAVQSGSVILPQNPSISPVGSLNLYKIVNTACNSPPCPLPPPNDHYNSTTMFVKVLDIFGRPVKGTGVTFTLLPGSNNTAIRSVSTYFNITNSTGIASVTVTWTQTMVASQAVFNYVNIGTETAALPVTNVPLRYDISYP